MPCTPFGPAGRHGTGRPRSLLTAEAAGAVTAGELDPLKRALRANWVHNCRYRVVAAQADDRDIEGVSNQQESALRALDSGIHKGQSDKHQSAQIGGCIAQKRPLGGADGTARCHQDCHRQTNAADEPGRRRAG